jgi:iron complex outermembrane receptor protein
MHTHHTILAGAVLSALATFSHAQTIDQSLPTVTVTEQSLGTAGDQILIPAKIVSGEDLKNKLGSSLGDTLSHELGVSASGFGAGASRPIIRGLDGPRVKILENGMSASDVSSISNDHAVAVSSSSAREIEVLSGPAALLYGSGAIGGLVNIVNERIPTELVKKSIGEAELRYSTVDKAKGLSLSGDDRHGRFGLHVDANVRNATDYKIPGNRLLDDPNSSSGTLPLSFTKQNNIGLGGALIERWGYVGVSASVLNNLYGVPTLEGSQIDQSQHRYDFAARVDNPLAGIENLQIKLGYTDYQHKEFDLNSIAQTNFTNQGFETRAEFTHKTIAGFHGVFGIQTDNTKFSALNAETGAPDTVPKTKSNTTAAFLVEERLVGFLKMNAGLRLESVKRMPIANTERSFDLASYSIGSLWPFANGYGVGLTGSVGQRAPGIEELYSAGPHDATGTFDIGNPNLVKENSRNIELTLQKTSGLLRWKGNLFKDYVQNFVYGQIPGATVNENGEAGGRFRVRQFGQTDATIEGFEAEVSYNMLGEGLSTRAFGDQSRGRLENNSSLPLQPATRFGMDLNYKRRSFNSGLSVVRALKQERLASFETTPTNGYTQLDATAAVNQKLGSSHVTWFVLAKNLLNQDIRLSTSLIKDVAPLPGRNFVIGMRTYF